PPVSRHFLPHEVLSSTVQGSRIEPLSLAFTCQLLIPAIRRYTFISTSSSVQ
ncbi:hypothetical protein KI387_035048, partial [Taxus chinensis]